MIMKAIEILDWIIRESIEGEALNIITVPNVGEHSWEQNEDWWRGTFGACPPDTIPSGAYLYYYSGSHDEIHDRNNYVCIPDAVVHLEDDEELIYFSRMED